MAACHHSLICSPVTVGGNSLWYGEVKKGKVHPVTYHEGKKRGGEVYLYSFVTLALDGPGGSVPHPGHFTPGKET
jgi:hypothetical protein